MSILKLISFLLSQICFIFQIFYLGKFIKNTKTNDAKICVKKIDLFIIVLYFIMVLVCEVIIILQLLTMNLNSTNYGYIITIGFCMQLFLKNIFSYSNTHLFIGYKMFCIKDLKIKSKKNNFLNQAIIKLTIVNDTKEISLIVNQNSLEIIEQLLKY